jgi:hypothetical protein
MATKKPEESLLPADAIERAGAIAPIRLASLALAAKLDAAKLRSLKLEHARVRARYGERTPELERIDAAFDAAVASVKIAALDVQRARLPPIKPTADKAVVHGRVVDAEGKGMNAVTVTAHDSDGKSIGSSKSDAAGYYHIALAAPAAGIKPKVSLRTTPAGSKHAADAHELELIPGLAAIVDMVVRD